MSLEEILSRYTFPTNNPNWRAAETQRKLLTVYSEEIPAPSPSSGRNKSSRTRQSGVGGDDDESDDPPGKKRTPRKENTKGASKNGGTRANRADDSEDEDDDRNSKKRNSRKETLRSGSKKSNAGARTDRSNDATRNNETTSGQQGEEEDRGEEVDDDYDDSSERDDPAEQDDEDDIDLCSVSYEQLEGRHLIRVGLLQNPAIYRHPRQAHVLALRQVVVALVDDCQDPVDIDFIAVDGKFIYNGKTVTQ